MIIFRLYLLPDVIMVGLKELEGYYITGKCSEDLADSFTSLRGDSESGKLISRLLTWRTQIPNWDTSKVCRQLEPHTEVLWDNTAPNSLCPAPFPRITPLIGRTTPSWLLIGYLLYFARLLLAGWAREPSACFVLLSGQQRGSGVWEEGKNQRKDRMRLEGLRGWKDPSKEKRGQREETEGGTEPKRRERGTEREGEGARRVTSSDDQRCRGEVVGK